MFEENVAIKKRKTTKNASSIKNKKFSISPCHTTHSGGKGEYFHDWYKYLEGYSSEFVKHIKNTYLPNSKLIIDPFAGVGTTPITLCNLGIDSAYCEINPAMQKIITSKLKVLKLNSKEKIEIHDEIIKLSKKLPTLLLKSKVNEELSLNHHNAFGASNFFSENVFKNILKLRTLIDKISINNKLLALLTEVAVMSQLIECSLLKRAGDLRYKTAKELSKGIPDLLDAIQQQLNLIANDVLNCNTTQVDSILIADNAKDLITKPKSKFDGVITSPPYLNGTNYFRNTKLELWFIKEIVNNKSLRSFRDDAIISGINDVVSTKGKIIHKSLTRLHKKLISCAYDQRIPKMVAGYFEEMGQVFSGLKKHLKKDAIACIDIGDSIYSGIHIPTHEILIDVAHDYGFNLMTQIKLRERTSNNGTKLTQTLLVLRNTGN